MVTSQSRRRSLPHIPPCCDSRMPEKPVGRATAEEEETRTTISAPSTSFSSPLCSSLSTATATPTGDEDETQTDSDDDSFRCLGFVGSGMNSAVTDDDGCRRFRHRRSPPSCPSAHRCRPATKSNKSSRSSRFTVAALLAVTVAAAAALFPSCSEAAASSRAGVGAADWNLADVHHRMSVGELRDVFHVESHDDVPKYEVVHVTSQQKRRRRRRRSAGGADDDDDVDNSLDSNPDHLIRLSAMGKDVSLSLRHNADFHERHADVPMYAADSDADARHKLNYQKILDADFDVGVPYQDIENQAAVLVQHDPHDESLLLDGVIGDKMVIKPAPISVKKHYYRLKEEEEKRREEKTTTTTTTTTTTEGTAAVTAGRDEYDEYLSDSMDGEESAGLHIVYEKEKPVGAEPFGSDYMLMEPDGIPTASTSSSTDTSGAQHRRRKRSAPYVIYPEVLIIVDYDSYLLHNGDNRTVKKYMVSFWNGVDLRYRSLKDPRIRVSIAGIIISRGRDATPYLEASKVGRDSVDSAEALTEMGKYLFVERRLPTYDIAVVITRLDMCRRRDQHSPCNRGTAGFAYVGGACVVNKRLEKVNSVAIVEDTGGFSGIIVAAHEIGHLLGAVHDGTPPPSYLGGPGATKCKWEDGYIMSDLRHTDTGFQWSSCSIDQFHHFLHGDTASCLYNTPHEEETLPRFLPGKLMSLDAQCRKDRGTSACFSDERVCAQLFCFDATSGYCVSYRPAAEGSPCGDGKFCVNGKCVEEDENAIPDFNELSDSLGKHDGVAIRDVSGFQGSASTVQNNLFPKRSTAAITERSSTAAVTSGSTRKFNNPWRNAWRTSTTSTSSAPSSTTSSTTTTTTTTTTEAPVVEERSSTAFVRPSSRRYPWWTTKNAFTTRSTSTRTTSIPLEEESPASFGLSLSQSRRENTTPRGNYYRVTPTSQSSTAVTTKVTTSALTAFLSQKKPRWPPPPGTNFNSNWPGQSKSTKEKDGSGAYKTPEKTSTSTTTTTTTSPTTTSTESSTSSSTTSAAIANSNKWQPPANAVDQGDTCQDLLTSMAGGLTCHEFLKSYGYRYCQHRYIQEKCCYSHRALCTNSRS